MCDSESSDCGFSSYYKDYTNPVNEKGYYDNTCVLCYSNSDWGTIPRVSPACSECREEFDQQINCEKIDRSKRIEKKLDKVVKLLTDISWKLNKN